MGTKVVTFEIPEDLYERLYRAASKLRSSGETYAEAIDEAVEIALIKFLDDFEERPSFKEQPEDGSGQ